MFFKKENNKPQENFEKIAALLIHAAKIDENYTSIEKEIIKKTVVKLGADSNNINKIMEDAQIIEENSNQILDFTKEVKSMDKQKKIEIVEALWKIIFSNKNADIFETNLMRRLAGLLYIDSKIMGDIKDKIKKENQ